MDEFSRRIAAGEPAESLVPRELIDQGAERLAKADSPLLRDTHVRHRPKAWRLFDQEGRTLGTIRWDGGTAFRYGIGPNLREKIWAFLAPVMLSTPAAQRAEALSYLFEAGLAEDSGGVVRAVAVPEEGDPSDGVESRGEGGRGGDGEVGWWRGLAVGVALLLLAAFLVWHFQLR